MISTVLSGFHACESAAPGSKTAAAIDRMLHSERVHLDGVCFIAFSSLLVRGITALATKRGLVDAETVG
jgi:hypothetical protein